MDVLFEQAMKYHDRGFSIVPLNLINDKDREGKVKKIPAVKWTAYIKTRVEKKVLMTDWKPMLMDKPGKGVAIITGEISGVVVVDMDDKGAVDIVRGLLPEGFKTVTAITGRGGYHLYFRYRPGLKSTSGLGNTGLDIRADGGIIAAPPSQFPANWNSGYRFVEGRGFGEVELAKMPDDLFNHLVDLINRFEPVEGKSKGSRSKSGKKEKTDWFREDLKGVGEGRRTSTLTRVCGKLKRLRIEKEDAWEMIKAWNQLNTPPEDALELEKQFNSLWTNVVEKENVPILEQLNERYSIITSGNNTRVMYQDQYNDLHFFTRSDFKLKLENQRIPWGNKTVSVADLWLEWEDRKTYEKCVFDPNERSEGCFNLWRGFPLVPKAGDWSLFQKHVEENIAGPQADWVFKWMARILQDPGGDRPGTTIVLRGKQGTGKGVFANHFGRLFGDHYKSVNDMNHVTGRFNKELTDAILLYIDEATWGGDVLSAGKLKNLITEPMRRVEAKGVDAIYVENHLSLIISSNNQWVVPAGPMERRFLVLDVSDEHMQDHVYFRKIIKQLKNGGYEAMMYDLQNLKYDLDELRNIPRTMGTRDQVLKGMDFIEKFWYERLYRGTMVDSHDYWKNRVVTDKLYNQYIDYCQQRNFSKKIDDIRIFKRSLHNMCKSAKSIQIMAGGKRFYVTEVPDLPTCRKEFDTFIVGKEVDDWPDVAEPDNIDPKDRFSDFPGSFRRGQDPIPF